MNFYSDNTKLFTKIIVQLNALLIVADIVWLVVMMPAWSHAKVVNNYWDGLSGMHTFVVVIAFVELVQKVLIAAYLVYDFKEKNQGMGRVVSKLRRVV